MKLKLLFDFEFHDDTFGVGVALCAIQCDNEDCKLIHGWALQITLALWTLNVGWSTCPE